MSTARTEIITISDDEDETGIAVGAVKKPLACASAPASTVPKDGSNEQGSPSTRSNGLHAAVSSPSNFRSTPVIGSVPGQRATKSRSSEPSDATPQPCPDLAAPHNASPVPAPRSCPEHMVAPIANMHPWSTSEFRASAPSANMSSRSIAGEESSTMPDVPFRGVSAMDFSSLLAAPMTYQQIACGLSSDYYQPYGLPTPAATPVSVSQFQGLMDEGRTVSSNRVDARQTFPQTPTMGLPAQGLSHAPVGLQAPPVVPRSQLTMCTQLEGASPASGNQLKRKSNGAPTPASKRTKTPVASQPNSTNTVVNSVLWSTPPHDPSKDKKIEEPAAPAPKPSRQRRPRNKPWTCKMLADLGAFIEKSVSWDEFAEKNGKSLADVLETYSVVVSMPLLEFAERGEKRIAQKKFREMKQQFKEKEKDVAKSGNDEGKKTAEDGNIRKKVKEAKRKEADPNADKPSGTGKKASGKKSTASGLGKTQVKTPALDVPSKAAGDGSKNGAGALAQDTR